MGLDTTIQKSKIGDGTTEWASLPWLNGDVTNPNLLHNWDFRNPVNQRGKTGNWTSGYNYDRWYLGGGTVTINSGYLAVTGMSHFNQYIDGVLLAGKVVTISVMKTDGTVYSGSTTVPTTNGAIDQLMSIEGVISCDIQKNEDRIRVEVYPRVAMNIQAIKLEMGTVSTLAYDPPMDYTTERLKCLRYCRRYDGYLVRPVEIYTTSARFFTFGRS